MSKELMIDFRSPIINGAKAHYRVEILTMYGDCDYYTTMIIDGFTRNDTDIMAHLIDTLQACKDTYPFGRGGSSKYLYSGKVPGFDVWFTGDTGIGPLSPIEEKVREFQCRSRENYQRTELPSRHYHSDDFWPWGEEYDSEATLVDWQIIYTHYDGSEFKANLT